MRIIFKSDKGNFNAIAEYSKDKIILLKNSVISNKIYNCKISPKIEQLRKDKNIIENNILQKNLSFSSLSATAEFVSGYKANGLRVWRTEDGKKIKEDLK